MHLIYGTTNPAKLATMRQLTRSLGLVIDGPADIGLAVPPVEESGRNPLDNAIIKARACYAAFRRPVFSCDSGLYFDGLADDEQPGVHVRRVGGRELSDEEMIAYYSQLAARHGGQLIGRYRNAICLAINDEQLFTSMDDSLSGEPFILTSRPHAHRAPGFPLDSLSMDMATGQYYHDLPVKPRGLSTIDKGFLAFFAEALKALA